MKLTISILVFVLVASCTPTGYIVDTRPYTAIIAADPSKVLIDPAHVKEVGGFQAEIGGQVITDYGTVGINDGKISIDPVVDLRSGK